MELKKQFEVAITSGVNPSAGKVDVGPDGINNAASACEQICTKQQIELLGSLVPDLKLNPETHFYGRDKDMYLFISVVQIRNKINQLKSKLK